MWYCALHENWAIRLPPLDRWCFCWINQNFGFETLIRDVHTCDSSMLRFTIIKIILKKVGTHFSLSSPGCRFLTPVSIRSVCLRIERGRSLNKNSPSPSPTLRASAWSDQPARNHQRAFGSALYSTQLSLRALLISDHGSDCWGNEFLKCQTLILDWNAVSIVSLGLDLAGKKVIWELASDTRNARHWFAHGLC